MSGRQGWFAASLLSGWLAAAAARPASPGIDPPNPADAPLRLLATETQPPVGDELAFSRLAELEQRIAALESSTTVPPPPAASVSSAKLDPLSMRTGWGKNGFQAVSANGEFSIHVGGRVQLDAVALQDSALVLGGVGTNDALDFRRARLRVDGTMYQTMDWCVEVDFVNGADFDPTNAALPVTAQGGDVDHVVAPTDLWWAFNDLPVIGHMRLGNQKEPIGLEHLCSSRYLDFMERSFLQDAYFGPFNNGFSPGVSIYDWNEDETITYTLGAFKNVQNVFAYDTGDNEYALTGRVAGVPWAADDDAKLLHLGLAASYRGLDQDAAVAAGNVRMRSRASLRNGPGPLNPNLADTNFSGRIFADDAMLLAPEIALAYGPWLWQAEYVAGFLNGVIVTPSGGGATPTDQGFPPGQDGQGLYFLTGEHRAYERHEGRFGRVVPRDDLRWNSCGFRSWGAWQIGARYGFLDLNDGLVQGGSIQDLTIGLNWFLNPFAKLQFNYVHQRVDNTILDNAGAVVANNDGTLDGFGVRFAQDF